MGASIDELSIEITGSADKANKAISELEGNLRTLSNALGGFKNVSAFKDMFGNMPKGNEVKGLVSFANTIQKLSTSMTSLQGIASKGIGIEGLRQNIKDLEGIKFDASNLSGITTLANSLSKIGSKTGATATGNLIPLADNLKRFVTEMNGVQSVAFDAESLSRLASSISKIGGIKVSNATTTLPQLTSSLKTFVTEMNKVEGVSFNTEGLSNLANSISRLGSKTSTVAVDNIPKLKDAINNLLTDLSKAPAISDNTVRSLEAMAQLANKAGNSFNGAKSGISNFTNNTVVNFDKVKSAANKVISAFGKVAVAAGRVTGINNIVNSLKRLIPTSDGASKGIKGLAMKFGTLYASAFMGVRVFKKLGGAIESAMDYVEGYDYFKNAFAQVAENADLSQWKDLGYKSADAYANSFKERAEKVTAQMTGFNVGKYGELTETGQANLGLNPTQVMETQALFGQMSSSMGVASESALKLSRVYTKLGADLASVKNMDFSSVWENLSGALVGMSRNVDKFGVNIRNANMQLELQKMGIDANITKMSQQDKALLRTIIILNSTKYAWGNLAQTISSPSNQIRLLTANFQSLSQMLGSLFLPIVSKVLPYINALVIAFKSLVSYVGGLLGVDLSDYMKSLSAGGDNEALSAAYDDADNLAESLDNAGDSAEKAAKKQKKFNKQLQAFDELNNLSTTEKEKNPKSSSSASSGTPNLTSDLTAALDDAIKKYEEAWKKAFNNMENDANNIAQKIKKAFVRAWTTGNGYEIGKALAEFVNKGINWWNKHLPTFASTSKKIAGILATAVNGAIWNLNWSGLGKAIGGSIKAYLDANTHFFDTVQWEKLGRGLADSLNEFVDSGVIESYFENIGSKIRAIIETIFGFSEGFDFTNLGTAIGKGLNKILGKMDKKINGLSGWEKLGKTVSNLVKGALDTGIAFLKTFKWEKLGKGISKAITSVDFKGIAIKLTNFSVAIFNAVTKFLGGVSWFKVGQKIGDFIGNIGWGKIAWNFAKLAGAVVKAIGAAFVGSLSKAPIETAIVGLFIAIKWASGTKLGKGVFKELAKTVNSNIATAIGGSSGDTLEKALATKLGSILKSAAPALPYVAVATAILGLFTAAWHEVKEGKYWKLPKVDDSDIKQEVRQLKDSIEKLKTASHNAKEDLRNWNNVKIDADSKATELDTLKNKFINLKDNTHRTAVEEAQYKEITNRLANEIPGFNKLIDKKTGAYKGTTEQLEKLVEKTKAYYKVQAAQEQLKKTAKNLVDLEIAQGDAKEKTTKLAKKQKELVNKWEKEKQDLYKKGLIVYDNATKRWVESGVAMSEQDEERIKKWHNTRSEIIESKKELDKANNALNDANDSLKKEEDQYNKINNYIDENNKELVKENKNLKNNSKTIKQLSKETKKIGTIKLTAKIDNKTKKQVESFKSLKDKTVTAIAKAKKTGDFTKVSQTWDKFKDKAEKVLTAALDGKLDKKSYDEVMNTWNSLSKEDKKTLKANLTGEQLQSFKDMQKTFNNIKDKTVKVSAKSGTVDVSKIDNKIKTLERKKIELKTKGDTSGMASIDKKIQKLEKKKIKIQAEINISKATNSWKNLVENTKNWDKLPTAVQNAILKNIAGKATGGIFKGGKWNPIQRYASGGFPSAQVFMARESGPELVGTIGNHTAVVNNDQIVASVSDGVAKALAPAINQMTNTLLGMQNSSGSVAFAGEVPVYIDGREVFRAMGNQNDDYKRRTGHSRF